jgi:hypothetical protein
MSPTATLSETEVILANQKTILQNQVLILKGQEEIKKNQELLNTIVKNQDQILAGQRHCMYRDALEQYLRTARDPETRQIESMRH